MKTTLYYPRMTRVATHLQYALVFAKAGLITVALSASASAAGLSAARLYVELNDTDGDLGLHAFVDGDPYKKLEIENPKERVLFVLSASGPLSRQGLTELTFESGEPSFDVLSPKQFFARFPEGIYEIEATALSGREYEANAKLSHVLAAPVGGVTVSGVPAAENCDASALPTVSKPVVIDWNPVTSSHPTIGKSGAVKISKYQFFAEHGNMKFAVDLPPTVTQFEVPSELIDLADDFKFEIIATTSSGNNTAVESCFIVQK